MNRLSSDEIELVMYRLSLEYPGVAVYRCEGLSEDARKICSLTVGRGRKTLVCTGGVHGRESINPTVLVKMLEKYCADCTMDKKHILNRYRICVVPLLNPDGYEIALRGFGMIRNAKPENNMEKCAMSSQQWRENARAVDINRNFPCLFYQKRKETDYPLSEAESRILARIFEREESIGYIDFHSRGKEIYWYRSAMDNQYNVRQRDIARCLALECGYKVGQEEQEMPDITSGGNTVQYYAEYYKMPAITVETIEEEATFPLSEKWLPVTYHEIKNLPPVYLEYVEKYYFPSDRIPFR